MRRSDKKRLRNLNKTKEWSLKEAQKAINSWKVRSASSVVKSKKYILLRSPQEGFFPPSGGSIKVGELLVVLDMLPLARKGFFGENYEPLVMVTVLCKRGIGCFVFDKHQFLDLSSTSHSWASVVS